MINKVIGETLELLKIIAPIMFISLILSNIFFLLPQIKNLMNKIKYGGLMFAFLVHPIVGLSVLANLYKKQILKEGELTYLFIISLIPKTFRRMLIILGPLAISTLGPMLGLTYITLELLSSLIIIRIIIFLIIKINKSNKNNIINNINKYKYNYELNLKECIIRSVTMFFRILAILAPSIFIVMLLLELGFLELLNRLCEPVLVTFNLSSSGLVIIVAGTSSMIAGIGIAGSLIAKNIIDKYSALLFIFIASLFHTIVELVRIFLPLNISLFGVKLGIKLSFINFITRILTCILSIIILLTYYIIKI